MPSEVRLGISAVVAGLVVAGPAFLAGAEWYVVLGTFLAGAGAYLKTPVQTNV